MRATFGKILCTKVLGLGLLFAGPAMAELPKGFDFGDDSGSWTNDGECDDPRFEGEGMAGFLLPEDILRDASDCRALYQAGKITVVAGVGGPTSGEGVDFGDDSGSWTNDGECDDPRFEGPGMASFLLDDDILSDASDCRALFEAGAIWLK